MVIKGWKNIWISPVGQDGQRVGRALFKINNKKGSELYHGGMMVNSG